MAILGALAADGDRGWRVYESGWAKEMQNDVYCRDRAGGAGANLAGPDSILIVKFAEQLQHRGLGLVKSEMERRGYACGPS